jgi:GTP-binding protein HflX
VFTPDQNESWQEEELYEELKELSNTAGLDVVDYLVQHRNAPDAAYCIGKGKLTELFTLCAARDADCVILIIHYLRLNCTI